ncbi:sulfate adenylyltransferase subunit 1, partial [Pilimelia anulata]|uniref:sulfate adenylyltransferase subunit 1 n=1 Tax=Pilimelia anulata TaxID=53371 RepID=UPI00166CADB4
TPRRKFIIADTPGHIQYTRNMATGASTADLALVLVDARKGLVEQSRRHALLCSLLRVPHLVLCVNKMDLVDWSAAAFEEITEQFAGFAAKLDVPDLTAIPISALRGDNVVERSAHMPWYEGPSLLHHLEHVHIASDRNLVDVRFPVQYVIEAEGTRRYAGQVASGVLRAGDEVLVLPSGLTTRIAAVETADGPVDEAYPPMSVTIRLDDDLDVSRGDLLCRPHNAPTVAQDIDAMVCWMDETQRLAPGGRYLVKHTTRFARAEVRDIRYRLDIDTLHRDAGARQLDLNGIGRIRLRTADPLFVDEYRRNRTTGGFILIDEVSHRTVGAGMVV